MKARLERWAFYGCLIVFAMVFASCGRDPRLPELVPVSGTVTLGGRPLSGALVRFLPVGETRGSAAGGRTDAEGKYRLYSNRAEEGTAVGEYRVTIEMVPGGDPAADRTELVIPSDIPRAPQGLPPLYGSPAKTPLKATVPEGGGVIDFAL
jgi:hypothetical protein